MSRHWLLTSTTYGAWLPGDERGFVSTVRDRRPEEAPSAVRLRHNEPGTPCDAGMEGLRRSAAELMKGPPVRFDAEQAAALAEQFRATAAHRGWTLHAFAVMANHVHWVVSAPAETLAADVLGDLKGYGSRALSRRWGRQPSGTWWTEGGSKRPLRDEAALRAAIEYVRNQKFPLVVWTAPDYEPDLEPGCGTHGADAPRSGCTSSLSVGRQPHEPAVLRFPPVPPPRRTAADRPTRIRGFRLDQPWRGAQAPRRTAPMAHSEDSMTAAGTQPMNRAARRNPLAALALALAGWLLAVAGGRAAAADPVQLLEKVAVGQQTLHKVSLEVTGTMKMEKGPQPLTGKAALHFPEKVLAVGQDGMASKVVRHYGAAHARFVVAGGDENRSLRRPSRLLVGERRENLLSLWAPAGILSGDERELVEDILDVTRIPGLLPPDPVRQGAKWKVEPLVAQALCNLEGYISSDLVATLVEVTEDKATVQVAGPAHGMSLGSEVKMTIAAHLTFDLKAGMVEKLSWTQEDDRAASPVAPEGKYTAKIVVERQRVESPELAERNLAEVRTASAPEDFMLLLESPDGGFRLRHDRDWHLTALQPVAVLRRMKASEFVAQLSVSVLADKPSANKATVADFERIAERQGGWKLEKIVGPEELPAPAGRTVLRITASGKAGERALLHRHYLVTTDSRQVLVSVLYEPAGEAKLADLDAKIVQALEFSPPVERAAARPPADTPR